MGQWHPRAGSLYFPGQRRNCQAIHTLQEESFAMPALVLDGKTLASQTEEALLARVERLKAKAGGKTPILATILVGDDPASATYVKMKGNACRRVGMDSLAVELPAATTTTAPFARTCAIASAMAGRQPSV